MQKQAPHDKAAQMRLMVAAYEKMGKALKATGRPMFSRSASTDGTRRGSGRRRWAETCGGQRATSIRIGTASTRSSRNRTGWRSTRGQGTGTIRTCLRWATASCRLPKTGRIFHVGHAGGAAARGTTLPDMKPEIKAILTNKDVIAIDQDSLGKQGTRAYSDGEVEVWTRQLSGGAMAVAVLAAGDSRYSTHHFI